MSTLPEVSPPGPAVASGVGSITPRLVLPQQTDAAGPPPPPPEDRPALQTTTASDLRPRPGMTQAAGDLGQPAPANPPSAHPMSEAPLSGAALTVAGRVFTVDEILRPIWGELERLSARLSESACRVEAIDLISNQLRAEVAEHLVLQEAERSINERAREDIEKTLSDRMRDQVNKLFGGSERMMKQELKRRGLSYEQEMDRQRRTMLVQAYLREKLMPQIHVTRPEAYSYYEKHLDEFTREATVRIKLIQVRPERWYPPAGPVSREQRLEAVAKARRFTEQVLAMVRSGVMSFERAAIEHSDDPQASSGGDWGCIRRGGLRARKVEETAFALKAGQVSEVIEDAEAFYLVMVADATALKVTPFSEAVAGILPRLERQKFAERSAAYMLDLYRQAAIDEHRVARFVEAAWNVAPKPVRR